MLRVKETKDGGGAAIVEVVAAEHAKLVAMVNDIHNEEEKEKIVKTKQIVLSEIHGKRKGIV